MLKINENKMKELGFKFESMEDVYFYAESIINWLESHNKNYTKEQYNKITVLKDLIEILEVE